jgi:hypothetical protein
MVYIVTDRLKWLTGFINTVSYRPKILKMWDASPGFGPLWGRELIVWGTCFIIIIIIWLYRPRRALASPFCVFLTMIVLQEWFVTSFIGRTVCQMRLFEYIRVEGGAMFMKYFKGWHMLEEWSASRTGLAVSPGKDFGYHWIGGWVCFRAGLDRG